LQQQLMEALCEHWLAQQEVRENRSPATQEQSITINLRAVAEASAVPFTPALQALLDTLQQAARSD